MTKEELIRNFYNRPSMELHGLLNVMAIMDIWAKYHAELAFHAGFESGEYEGEQVVKYLSDPNEGLLESKEEYISKTFPE